MSSDYERVTVSDEPRQGRVSKAWDVLQSSFTQSVETVTRNTRFEISGGNVDQIDAPEHLDELVDTAKSVGFVWRGLQIFATDVWEPGYRLEGPEQTKAYFMGEDDEIDASPPEDTPEGGFLKNCGVFAGEKRQGFYDIGKMCTLQRRLRGTVTLERLKANPDDPNSEIHGYSFIRPETLSAEVYPNSNILIEPDDTDQEGVELTKRDEAAAYIQFDDNSILGLRDNFRGRNEVPLSQNDVHKQVFSLGIGDDAGDDTPDELGVFGTSQIEPISEDITEYRNIKRERHTAIQNKAYGIWLIEHGRDVLDLGNKKEVVEWDDESMDDFEGDLSNIEPGGYLTYDGSVDVNRVEGDVPDLSGVMQEYVNNIMSGLPTPKYKVGFEDNINRDVTGEQNDDYDIQVSEEREYQERQWTKELRDVAQRKGLDTEGLRLRIEPEPQDSPVLSLSETEIDKLATYAEALNNLAGPQGGPQTLVDVETLLTDVAQLPESALDTIDEDIQELPEGEQDTMETFMDIMEMDTLANRYSEGDIVNTPDGDGVVMAVWTESWEADDEQVEASDDSPAYTVALVDGGFDHYQASDLESTEFEEIEDVDDPVEDIQSDADVMSATMDAQELDTLDWSMPDSWRESSKPARLILLDAWASMGGQFDCGGACCMGELKSRRLCGAMKDEVYGTTAWRGWGPD